MDRMIPEVSRRPCHRRPRRCEDSVAGTTHRSQRARSSARTSPRSPLAAGCTPTPERTGGSAEGSFRRLPRTGTWTWPCRPGRRPSRWDSSRTSPPPCWRPARTSRRRCRPVPWCCTSPRTVRSAHRWRSGRTRRRRMPLKRRRPLQRSPGQSCRPARRRRHDKRRDRGMAWRPSTTSRRQRPRRDRTRRPARHHGLLPPRPRSASGRRLRPRCRHRRLPMLPPWRCTRRGRERQALADAHVARPSASPQSSNANTLRSSARVSSTSAPNTRLPTLAPKRTWMGSGASCGSVSLTSTV
jgi:hypothetical protein